MNIFLLSRDPKESARMLCDKHVVKMITETCQILSTALLLKPGIGSKYVEFLYKPTHTEHPCVKWCLQENNFIWTNHLLTYLLIEYEYRFGRKDNFWKAKELSKIFTMIEKNWINNKRGNALWDIDWKSWPQCVTPVYKNINPVKAYLCYYFYEKKKTMQCKWSKREEPNWMNHLQENNPPILRVRKANPEFITITGIIPYNEGSPQF